MIRVELGAIFALFGIPAWIVNDDNPDVDGNEVVLPGGLYVLEDRVYPDRSCGQWEAGYLVCRLPDGFSSTKELKEAGYPRLDMYFVSDWEIWPQIDPQGEARRREDDRHMSFMEEKQYAWERENGLV